MVVSGIPRESWEIKLKKCETSPRPSEGRLCARPGPMATQIHTYPTRGVTCSRQIRDIILSFIHVVPSLWTSGIGCKKLASPTIISIRDL